MSAPNRSRRSSPMTMLIFVPFLSLRQLADENNIVLLSGCPGPEKKMNIYFGGLLASLPPEQNFTRGFSTVYKTRTTSDTPNEAQTTGELPRSTAGRVCHVSLD